MPTTAAICLEVFTPLHVACVSVISGGLFHTCNYVHTCKCGIIEYKVQPDCDADFIPIPLFERLMSYWHVWEMLWDTSYVPCDVIVALAS